jgi:3-deoxy-manno-octulosonate cytidylyltransferase (CMP-KDO synthetase)
MLNAIAAIPARFASTRFPGKPLAVLAGKTIIHRVYEAVANSGLFTTVLVATDDERIAAEVESFGGQIVMTRTDHPSGSDRIAEAVADIPGDIIVNVQGDEPFISAGPLTRLLEVFTDPSVQVASLMTPLTGDPQNPNLVKVVTALNGDALYFSRCPIPHHRDTTGVGHLLHIGVYAYRRETLLRMVKLSPTPLELTEKLEQLRLLENGIPIRMVETDYRGFGIDTPEDLDKAEARLRSSQK